MYSVLFSDKNDDDFQDQSSFFQHVFNTFKSSKDDKTILPNLVFCFEMRAELDGDLQIVAIRLQRQYFTENLVYDSNMFYWHCRVLYNNYMHIYDIALGHGEYVFQNKLLWKAGDTAQRKAHSCSENVCVRLSPCTIINYLKILG